MLLGRNQVTDRVLAAVRDGDDVRVQLRIETRNCAIEVGKAVRDDHRHRQRSRSVDQRDLASQFAELFELSDSVLHEDVVLGRLARVEADLEHVGVGGGGDGDGLGDVVAAHGVLLSWRLRPMMAGGVCPWFRKFPENSGNKYSIFL